MFLRNANRVLYRAFYDAHTENMFYGRKILKLRDLIKFQQAVYMYNGISNKYIRDHNHNTKNISHLFPSFQRLSITQHSLST